MPLLTKADGGARSAPSGDDAEPRAAAPPMVSVIVPHYRDLEGLDVCLAALVRQNYPRDRFEIIVADNASPQGAAAIAERIAGRARLVVVSERGAGPARNGGVKLAVGDVLAFTDSDCQPEAEWLSEGVRALAHCDFVGGAMRVLVRDEQAMSAAEAFEAVFAFDNESYVRRKGFTVTANLICPRDIFEHVGEFRAGVPEDMDWSHRARDAGYLIGYAEQAVVGHPARATWPQLEAKWRRLNAEAYQLSMSIPGARRAWTLKALALPLSPIFDTPKVLTSARLRPWRARLLALAMLYRLRLWRGMNALSLLSARERS